MNSIRVKKIPNNEHDIINISIKAKACKELNSNTIDATIGSLYDESGNFVECTAWSKAISLLTNEEKYTYSSMAANETFRTNVEKWIFGDKYNDLRQNKKLFTFPSMGGSSALSNILYSYLGKDDVILLPNLYWSVYKLMVETIEAKCVEYEMFKDGKFNMESFIVNADKIIDKQGYLVTLINTPNNNPTGYNYSYDEISKLLDYFKSKINIPIVFIVDIAYIDFMPYEYTRQIFDLFKNASNNILTIIVFSGSKSFSAYGMRFGSMTFITSDEKTLNNIKETQQVLIRTRYSSPNHMATSAFNKLMTSEDLFSEYKKWLNESTLLLERRAKLLIEHFDKNKIVYYPYYGGFFLTVKVCNAINVYNDLVKKNIYVIPINKGIRIAVSSLKLKDIERFVNELNIVLEAQHEKCICN